MKGKEKEPQTEIFFFFFFLINFFVLSRLHAQYQAQCGALVPDPDIKTGAVTKSQMTYPLSHPGTPNIQDILEARLWRSYTLWPISLQGKRVNNAYTPQLHEDRALSCLPLRTVPGKKRELFNKGKREAARGGRVKQRKVCELFLFFF